MMAAGRENEVVAALQTSLASLPNLAITKVRESVRFSTGAGGLDADAIICLECNGRPTVLLVEAKTSVYPRDAREAIWRLRKLQTAFQQAEGVTGALPVIASKTLSAGAQDFLRSENVGYYEPGGSLYLSSPDLYIFLDKPSSKQAVRSEKSLFSGRRSQVVLALLQCPDQWRGVKELAATAFASTATVSQVLIELEKREWAGGRGMGPHKQRRLLEPRKLLDAWAKHVMDLSKPKSRRFFVPALKSEELLERVHQICDSRHVAYEITGEWAAQIYSPFLSSIAQVRCRVHSEEAATLLVELKAREVSEGSNLALIETNSPGDFLFRENQRGIWLANPITVYLDLLTGGGRAKEMAEHLRQERIRL